MNEPSLVPVPKVAAAGIAGVVSIVVVFIAAQLDLEVPPEVASAFTTLAAFVAGYFQPSKKR
jgi:hypothetical protein